MNAEFNLFDKKNNFRTSSYSIYLVKSLFQIIFLIKIKIDLIMLIMLDVRSLKI